MLGDWEFFLMDSQYGATMKLTSVGYTSSSIAQRKQVIIRCVKRYFNSNSFEYEYVETFREL